MILTILQARLSSSRLPGKVLKPIMGRPMLAYQIERVKRARNIDQIIIATSSEPSDDSIVRLCDSMNVSCYRGSLNDVLDRFYHAALQYDTEHVVRLTGDCPLCDPFLIDYAITFHMKGSFDYTSNTLEPTYPDGLDVEVCRFTCLEQAWRETKLPSDREHVMPFIHQQPERFKLGGFKNAVDLSHLRWTVDGPLDFDVVSRIYEALYPKSPSFSMEDILAFLDTRPDLKTLNAGYERNEGYRKSLKEEALLMKKRGA